jgi:hypothetical protein
LTLLPKVAEEELRTGRNSDLDGQLKALFSGQPVSGETILSDYYGGAAPVDAEFIRGLAEGYYRNFLSSILKERPPKAQPNVHIKILIPDTFLYPDEKIRGSSESALGKVFPDSIKSTNKDVPKNTFYRILMMSYAVKAKVPFVYDIPTTILTIAHSSKFKKVKSAKYFSDEDLDRITDRLARRFSDLIWERILEHPQDTKWPLSQFSIEWLSSEIGDWGGEHYMNRVPLDRPSELGGEN